MSKIEIKPECPALSGQKYEALGPNLVVLDLSREPQNDVRHSWCNASDDWIGLDIELSSDIDLYVDSQASINISCEGCRLLPRGFKDQIVADIK